MLPWPTGTATLETRQKIYGNLVERYTGIRFMITVVKRSEWVLNEDGLKQWQERFGAHNPLDFLRIQQPHLSEELDKFYYSFSVFRVYHVSEWLRHIGQRRRSFIRRLHVWTGQYQIRNKSSELLRVVEQFADLLQQHKGVSDFQLSARLRRSGGRILATPSCPACEEDAPLLSPLDCAIEILGLEPIHLVLEIPQLHGLTSQDALAMVLRSLAPTDLENISPGKAIPNITATPALTPNAPRVNFLNTLPPELRLNIFSELCSDLDDPLNTYRKSPPWIRSPKTYAVSRQFIKEFGDAWCKRYPLHFRLEPRTFSNIYTVLSFVGSQILSHAKGLRFNYEFDLVGSWNYAWHIELVWLINALCSLSKKPDSPRTVSVILTELRPDQDFPNEENSDSIYSGQKSYWGGFEGVREDEFDGLFSFQAEFLVTPDNETAPVSRAALRP